MAKRTCDWSIEHTVVAKEEQDGKEKEEDGRSE